MKVQYLGTAAAEGIPGIFCNCAICKQARLRGGKDLRSRSQAIVDDWLLIDFPPDSYYHMLERKLDLPSIEHLLITHSHQDHFYPQELYMRCAMFANEVTHPLHIYGNDKMIQFYEEAMQLFDQELMAQCVIMHEINAFEPFDINGYTITALLANHDKSEKCLIYLIEGKDQTLLYANDTGWLCEESWAQLEGKKIDIINMDCTLVQFADGNNHMGLPDNIKMQDRLKEMGCITEDTVQIITHFSHNGKMLHQEMEELATPQGFLVAYDGMIINK